MDTPAEGLPRQATWRASVSDDAAHGIPSRGGSDRSRSRAQVADDLQRATHHPSGRR
jgi:hypothetical protein